MIKPRQKRLSLFISFLLMAFVFCQGMAQAGTLSSLLLASKQAGMASCHEMGIGPDQLASPTDCQHLDKAADTAGQPPLADYQAPVLIAFLLLPVEAPTSLQLAVVSPPDPASDPPLPIRFQRFRE